MWNSYKISFVESSSSKPSRLSLFHSRLARNLFLCDFDLPLYSLKEGRMWGEWGAQGRPVGFGILSRLRLSKWTVEINPDWEITNMQEKSKQRFGYITKIMYPIKPNSGGYRLKYSSSNPFKRKSLFSYFFIYFWQVL